MKKISNILLVEDETLIAVGLSLQLEGAGYRVCGQIATGEGAIQAAAETEPDLIIMDVNLAGGVDGIEAAKRILQHRPTLIIFITGYLDAEIDARVKKLAPAGLLRKPLRFQDLHALIEKQL